MGLLLLKSTANDAKELTLTGHSTTKFQKLKMPTKQLAALLTLMLWTTVQIKHILKVFLPCSVLFNLAGPNFSTLRRISLTETKNKIKNRCIRMENTCSVRNESAN